MNEGTIEQHEGRVVFRYERRLLHPIDTVWQAITDPDEIKQWIGNRPEIDLRPGGRYVSYHGAGDRVVDRVERVEPPRLFQHTFWVHINPTAMVTWELSPTEDGCRLLLTHSLDLEDVRAAPTLVTGDDITVILSRNGAGWHRQLDRLEAGLGGRGTTWSDRSQQALQDRYADILR